MPSLTEDVASELRRLISGVKTKLGFDYFYEHVDSTYKASFLRDMMEYVRERAANKGAIAEAKEALKFYWEKME